MLKKITKFIQIIPKDALVPGSPITCKACGHEFKIPSEFKDEWNFLKNPCINPDCMETYCNKKTTERVLFRLQDGYLEGNTTEEKNKYLEQMHLVMASYFTSILRGNPNISKQLYSLILTDAAFCSEMAYASSYYIILQYLKKKSFLITDSFSGYAYSGAFNDALFNRKNRDILGTGKNINKNDQITEVVSIDLMYDGDRGGESDRSVYPISNTDLNIEQIEKEEYYQNLIKQLIQIIMEATEKYVDGPVEKLATRVALLNFFKNGNNPFYSNKYFRVYGRNGKSLYEDIIELIGQEIKKESPVLITSEMKIKAPSEPKKVFINLFDRTGNKIYIGDYVKDITNGREYEIIEEERKGIKYYGYLIEEKFTWIDTEKVEVIKT